MFATRIVGFPIVPVGIFSRYGGWELVSYGKQGAGFRTRYPIPVTFGGPLIRVGSGRVADQGVFIRRTDPGVGSEYLRDEIILRL